MNPEPLHGAGGGVRDETPHAQSASKGFLSSVIEAGAAVHHPVLAGALSDYEGRWSTPANRLAYNVDAAGSQIQSVAVLGVEGDQHAADEQKPAYQQVSGQAPVVSKGINYTV